jgi:galactose mutarotase-like enzyme
MTSIKAKKDGMEFLWQGDSKYWKGQSIILFPIIGGIPDGKYIYEGQMYEMNPHGFARNEEYELVVKSQTELVYKLVSSEKTLAQYPFHFEFFVTYKLEGNKLKHGFIVNNQDTADMLFSVGAHPGFNCPLYPNETMEDYRLVFEKPENLKKRIKKGSLLSGETALFMAGEREKALSHSLFYDGAAILDHVASNWLEIKSSKNNRVIRVEFEGFPYLGIWSAANDGPFICIEPWFGVDSTQGDSYELTKKEGLVKLSSGGRFSCEYTIAISE